jgi:hypothetical protein
MTATIHMMKAVISKPAPSRLPRPVKAGHFRPRNWNESHRKCRMISGITLRNRR